VSLFDRRPVRDDVPGRSLRAERLRQGPPASGPAARPGRIDGAGIRFATRPHPEELRAPLDTAVVTSVALLSAIGVVMIHSTTAVDALQSLVPPYLLRHLSGIAAGVLIGVLAFRLRLERIRALALPAWAVGVGLLVATAVAGHTVNGARRWLELPGLGAFQPAEFAKLATLLAVAAVLSRRSGRSAFELRALVVPTALAVVPAALLLLQPDLGSAAVLLALTGLLILLAGAPLRLFVVPGALAAAGVAAYVAWQPYALRRILGFLQPWETRDAEGYQLVQSFVAFGRGGLFGTGLGAGRQKLDYLPEGHTDFILSMVAEELGLVGVLGVLGAFVALLLAGCGIARNARNRFAFFVASGMTLLITVPAVLNGMVVTGLLPTKGLALPFLSYGRSSLIVCYVAVALLLGIGCREGAPEPPKVRSAERRGLVSP